MAIIQSHFNSLKKHYIFKVFQSHAYTDSILLSHACENVWNEQVILMKDDIIWYEQRCWISVKMKLKIY
jgi:hypothetical protein